MPGKILIADDSPLVRQMVALMMEEQGLDVVQAENGEVALGKLAGSSLDMIVTDLNMPVIDGISFIQRARQLQEARFVPILILTSEGEPEMGPPAT
jgi:two-component system chemotaxis response regulator CheY